jgi:predicted dehydrogenase
MVGEALGLEVEAVAEAALRFRSGAFGHVHLDYVQRPPEHTLELIGEEGTLHWDGRTGELKVSTGPEWGWIHESPPAGYERNEMFMAEMAHFVRVVGGEAAPACSLEDGIRVQRMIETIRRSALQGETRDGG